MADLFKSFYTLLLYILYPKRKNIVKYTKYCIQFEHVVRFHVTNMKYNTIITWKNKFTFLDSENPSSYGRFLTHSPRGFMKLDTMLRFNFYN